jgi:hypothetical protein
MISRPPGAFHYVALFACVVLLAGVFAPVPARAQADPSPNPAAPPASPPSAKGDTAPAGSVKLKILVTNPDGNPVANASVYVRYYKDGGGMLHHQDLAELDLKTNQDGSVKVPLVPQGKIQIQVIAKGWHTFGEWYDVEKDEQSVAIQLQEPPHWY